MKLSKYLLAVAALSMGSTPVLAAANPAAKLSIAPASARVSAHAGKSKAMGGFAGIFALLIVAGVAATLITDATKSSDSP